MVVLVEDNDIGDEDTGFPSVDDRHSINTHEYVDQRKVQIGSAFKALLEIPTQFIASDQDTVSFVPLTDNGGDTEADRGDILLQLPRLGCDEKVIALASTTVAKAVRRAL